MNSNIIMYQSADSYDDIIDRVDNVLASPATLTAIACYNDQLATHLIGHLQKTGRRVPDDVSVVGFDNYDMAQVLSPTLTTVDHPKRRLGRDAGEMILKMINGEEVTSKTYDVPMIVGNSTKALK